MAHWLDELLNKKHENINKHHDVDADGLKKNIEDNKETIEAFMEQLNFLFDKLSEVIEDDFEFCKKSKSPNNLFPFEEVRFDAINATQPYVFMRRLDIIFSDKPGEVIYEFHRAKRPTPNSEWKFHDEQIMHCEISKMTDELAYELIDWFVWKCYFPRGIRV